MPRQIIGGKHDDKQGIMGIHRGRKVGHRKKAHAAGIYQDKRSPADIQKGRRRIRDHFKIIESPAEGLLLRIIEKIFKNI